MFSVVIEIVVAIIALILLAEVLIILSDWVQSGNVIADLKEGAVMIKDKILKLSGKQ